MSEFQIVVCRLGDESFGLDIASVYEVVDMASRFGLSRSELTRSTRIIVAGTSAMRVGLVVDAVTEVLMVSEDAVEPTPEAVSGAESGYIRGIAKLAGQLVILLDLSALFAADERATPARAA